VTRAAEFAAVGTTILAPSAATLSACLDKWAVLDACRGAVAVPRSALVDDALDPASWTWPAIVKPRHGAGGRGVAVVRGPADLERVPRDGSHLLQELLPGVEHSLDVLAYRDGRVASVVPRSRLKVDSGIAVAGCTVADPALIEYGRAVAETVGLTSVANVQVKANADGEPRLLEVNPRFPGSMPLTVASGVNMPRLALDDALGQPVPDHVAFEELAMVRSWQETFLPVEEFLALQPEVVR
jgi:carbamoyl-phosphate synthase large subunit